MIGGRGRLGLARCCLPVLAIPLLAQLTAASPGLGAAPPPVLRPASASAEASGGEPSSQQPRPESVHSDGISGQSAGTADHSAGMPEGRAHARRPSWIDDEALGKAMAPGQASADTASLCPAALAERSVAPALLRPGGDRARDRPGYAAELLTTALGWPRLERWCVWLEPLSDAAEPSQRRWQQGVSAALEAWASLLPLVRVDDPAAAQVRLLRRRPPLGLDASGRSRASRGRALLSLLAVQRRPGDWRLEPAVTVLIDPGQRLEALQATAVHELGHAFGLWGHSPDPADALAHSAGPLPVLRPSRRDRLTLEWLQRQPTPFGGPWPAPPEPASRSR